MEYKELFLKSVEAGKNAYAPFSKFNVGAAVLFEDGTVVTGVNVENSSYGGTICAERNAFTTAITMGKKDGFKAIAISGNGKEAFPCGICRQFMYEFAPDIVVVTGDGPDNLEAVTLRELLPHGFKL